MSEISSTFAKKKLNVMEAKELMIGDYMYFKHTSPTGRNIYVEVRKGVVTRTNTQRKY